MQQSPIQYRDYSIKFVFRKTTLKQGAQGGYAFAVCDGSNTVLGIGVKVFTFVEEDITEKIQQQLFELGRKQICAMIDSGEFESGRYYCYEWLVNDPQHSIQEIDCRDQRWGTVLPSLEHECE
jgi:hypothetical protein